MSLLEHLTLSGIKQLVDVKTFARGLDNYHAEAVGLLESDADFVSAVVQGTRPYSTCKNRRARKLGARYRVAQGLPRYGAGRLPCAVPATRMKRWP
ncbi:hypothetical protein QWZ03_14465 [Chitinimonas viridis]|uniref:Uncharacterized protein n=1 Tax=Chitinimonas viridis TaxID=664880 RepID=A0ABT8B879_9NEIS|nr:hypothetical protein [Chitinimonas viridis]MDN3577970.1 hypothetical protein [Chitinimonas viridis]